MIEGAASLDRNGLAASGLGSGLRRVIAQLWWPRELAACLIHNPSREVPVWHSCALAALCQTGTSREGVEGGGRGGAVASGGEEEGGLAGDLEFFVGGDHEYGDGRADRRDASLRTRVQFVEIVIDRDTQKLEASQ